MENVRLLSALVTFVLFLQVRLSLQTCRVVEVSPGVPNYQCNSIQELQTLQNPDFLNVSIVHGDSLTDRLGSAKKQPNLKVTLLENSDEGFGPNTINTLNNLVDLFKVHYVAAIPTNFLGNMPIKSFELEDTLVNKIETGAFSNLKSLEKLRLVKGKLMSISTGVFNNLPVEILSLANNEIGFIERNAFTNMKNLKALYLDGNHLTEFQPENLMTHRAQVEILWLNNNSLEEVDPNFLRNFSNLRELNLNNNKISKIFSYTFENSLNLERLYLSNNKLLQLHHASFPDNGMPNLYKLHIDNNRLSFLTNTVLGRLTKLKYIRIGGNPWQCPCLDTILRWLGDYGVQQLCDRDYYSGVRPICVVDDNHPTHCNYNIQEFNYYRYSEVNNKAPLSPQCDL